MKENDENHTKNIENNRENSNNSKQMISKDDNNTTYDDRSIENNISNNNAYSYNVSQASHASQLPKSSTNITSEITTGNIKGSHASQIDGTITTNLITCHYCGYTNSNEKEVERHSVISHPGKIARPDPSMLESIKNNEKQKVA